MSSKFSVASKWNCIRELFVLNSKISYLDFRKGEFKTSLTSRGLEKDEEDVLVSWYALIS